MNVPAIACLALCVILQSASAATPERPKIGLVLSGGGTKGGAHIGVLKVLEEQGVKPDYIVGTSVGAIMGAMYASGLSALEIKEAIAAIDWRDVLIDDPPRATVPIEMKRGDFDYLIRSKPGFSEGQLKFPLGLSQGQKASRLIRTLLSAGAGVDNFDNLAIPFRAVATSLETGEAVVLSHGDLASSVRASMSLPALFAPILIDGQYLVDGGVAANLPIDIARDMGAQVVIAVDISSPLRDSDAIGSLIDVSDQLVNIMIRRNVDDQVSTLGPQDILIKPEVSKIAMLDFERTLEAYEPGYTAALAQSHRLAELADHTEHKQRRLINKSTEAVASTPQKKATSRSPAKSPRIEFLEIRDSSGLAEKAVRARLKIELGQAFDRKSLNQSIAELYGTGLYQSIDYELIEKNGRSGIRVNAKAKSWGPDYLQFGMQLEENFSADTSFNFGLAYIRTAINGLGGQLRAQLDLGDRQGVYTELYQPWSYDGRLFSRIRLGYERNILRVYNEEDDAIADIGIRELGSRISLGRQFGRTSELELAWRSLYGEVNNLVGFVDTEQEQSKFDISEISLDYRYDTLNRTNRPSSGSLLRLSALSSPQSWRATSEYEQLHGLAMQALEIPGGQASFSAILGGTIESTAPLQSQFILGGTGRLSGHPINRFFGQHIAHLQANSSWDITRFALPAYAGLSAELGNTWNSSFGSGPDEWITAGSIYIGLNTVVGAVYVGAGFAEDGARSFYLSLGNPYTAKPIRPFDEN